MKKDSADGRLLIARVSLNMVKDAPAFGTGITGFRSEYLNYQADYFRTHPDSPWAGLADDVETPFNEFLKILIEQGIIGLLLFSCLLYFLSEKSVKAENTQNSKRITILQSVILFILIFALFSYPFDKLPFLVLFVSFIAGLSRHQIPIFNIRLRRIRRLRIPALLALCLVAGKMAWNANDYAKSCRAWNHALLNYGSGREESLSQLKGLYSELGNNPVFLTTYGKALSLSGNYPEAAMVLEKAVKRQPLSVSYIELGKSYEATGSPGQALECWSRASLTVPSRFTPLYLTMKLYFKNKEYDRAKDYAGQILEKKIKIDNPEIGPMKREARNILNFHPPPK